MTTRPTRDDPYYSALETPGLVTIQPIQALAIDGRGEPGGPVHIKAIQGLYAVASAVQAARAEFALPPLEGLWWVEDERPAFEVPREEWCWQLLLRTPDSVAADLVDESAGSRGLPVRLVGLAEGLCVQALHVGPYDSEPENAGRHGRAHEAPWPCGKWPPSRDLSDACDRQRPARADQDDSSPTRAACDTLRRSRSAALGRG